MDNILKKFVESLLSERYLFQPVIFSNVPQRKLRTSMHLGGSLSMRSLRDLSRWPYDIEDLIQSLLAERTWHEEHGWPAAFSLGLILGRAPRREAGRRCAARGQLAFHEPAQRARIWWPFSLQTAKWILAEIIRPGLSASSE